MAKELKVEKQLGVGCYHFVRENFSLDDWDQIEYEDGIRLLLESIDSVTNVNVSGLRAISFPCALHEFIDQEYRMEPILSDGVISFDIFIPYRVQKEVFYREAQTYCERFRVTTRYDYYFPVTIVEPIEPERIGMDTRPSDYLPVIREYLRKKIGDGVGGYRFICLGPSPFHANFYMCSSDQEDLPEDMKDNNRLSAVDDLVIIPRMGYNSVIFVETSAYGYDYFKEIIVSNLSVFYDVVYNRNSFNNLSEETVFTIRSTLARLSDGNPLRNLINSISRSNRSDIYKVHSNIFELESAISRLKSRVDRSRESLSGEGLASALYDYVDREVSDFPGDLRASVEGITRLSEVLEVSRANNRAIFLAAALSALATVLATTAIGTIWPTGKQSTAVAASDAQTASNIEKPKRQP